jgi:hypothetical protein
LRGGKAEVRLIQSRFSLLSPAVAEETDGSDAEEGNGCGFGYEFCHDCDFVNTPFLWISCRKIATEIKNKWPRCMDKTE